MKGKLVGFFSGALRSRRISSRLERCSKGRITRLDTRISKRLAVTRRVRPTGTSDVYNIMHGSAIRMGTNVYSPRWLLPTTIVEGRLIQFDTNITF